MSYNRTVSEFSSRRKITYGNSATENKEANTSNIGSLSLQSEAAISAHKCYYSKTENDTEVYIIEFNIGGFKFDELNIRTEGQKLFVQGQSVISANSDELSRDFSREFKLPNDVEPNTIKAHLDEKTRGLKLTGSVIRETKQNADSSSALDEKTTVIGSIKEKRSANSIEFDIYLGDQLKDGQIIFEVPNFVTLNVRVIKTETDSFGTYNLELKREIKLPNGAKLNNINHNIDSTTCNLHIQVPFK